MNHVRTEDSKIYSVVERTFFEFLRRFIADFLFGIHINSSFGCVLAALPLTLIVDSRNKTFWYVHFKSALTLYNFLLNSNRDSFRLLEFSIRIKNHIVKSEGKKKAKGN